MKKIYYLSGLSFMVLMLLAAPRINAQEGKEIFAGTVLYYGSGFRTRTITRTFKLYINGRTSDSQAQNFLGVLQESGQQRLLDAIDKQDLGRFSVGASVGVPINVVREDLIDGKQRIFIVFKRLTEFAEFRGGYRSLDYPFGVIEIYVDPRTGKGEGTYIAAAQIRWKRDKNEGYRVEIENFATFPAKLLGVTRL